MASHDVQFTYTIVGSGNHYTGEPLAIGYPTGTQSGYPTGTQSGYSYRHPVRLFLQAPSQAIPTGTQSGYFYRHPVRLFLQAPSQAIPTGTQSGYSYRHPVRLLLQAPSQAIPTGTQSGYPTGTQSGYPTGTQSTKQKRRDKNSTKLIRENCKIMGRKEIQSIVTTLNGSFMQHSMGPSCSTQWALHATLNGSSCST